MLNVKCQIQRNIHSVIAEAEMSKKGHGNFWIERNVLH